MFKIRIGTFETNSSSTHSLVIFTEDEYEKWVKKEIWLDWNEDKHTVKDVLDSLKEDGIDVPDSDYSLSGEEIHRKYCNEGEYDMEYYNCDTWGEYHEHDTNTYTTPGGEKLIIECHYGYDG